MKTKLCDVNPAAAEKLPEFTGDKSGIGVHYMDAYLKPMNIKLPDGTPVRCKRRGLKIVLSAGARKGEGLMRRLAVSRDPVVMLQAALQEAARGGGNRADRGGGRHLPRPMTDCLCICDRVAVVIGGTSGIGRALAVGLARNGANVVAAGRRMSEIETAAAEIEAAGRRTLRHTADATKRKSLDALRDAVMAAFGRVDILINAAGYTLKEPTAILAEEKWSALLDTNLTGVLRACQSFYSCLAQSGRGRIINIASLGSYLAFHQVAAYCAAKTAILSLTRSLACEWAADNISVNAIAPGVFPTEMNQRLVTGTARGQGDSDAHAHAALR